MVKNWLILSAEARSILGNHEISRILNLDFGTYLVLYIIPILLLIFPEFFNCLFLLHFPALQSEFLEGAALLVLVKWLYKLYKLNW
jgi:hypothetical protein